VNTPLGKQQTVDRQTHNARKFYAVKHTRQYDNVRTSGALKPDHWPLQAKKVPNISPGKCSNTFRVQRDH